MHMHAHKIFMMFTSNGLIGQLIHALTHGVTSESVWTLDSCIHAFMQIFGCRARAVRLRTQRGLHCFFFCFCFLLSAGRGCAFRCARWRCPSSARFTTTSRRAVATNRFTCVEGGGIPGGG